MLFLISYCDGVIELHAFSGMKHREAVKQFCVSGKQSIHRTVSEILLQLGVKIEGGKMKNEFKRRARLADVF